MRIPAFVSISREPTSRIRQQLMLRVSGWMTKTSATPRTMPDPQCPMWNSCGDVWFAGTFGPIKVNRCQTPARTAGQRRPSLSCCEKINRAETHKSLDVNPAYGVATGLLISTRRKTGDLYLVQKALGHRQITTTEIYAHVDDDSVRRAVAST